MTDPAIAQELLDAVEAWVRNDPLIVIEEAACTWWFDCWSPVTGTTDLETRRLRSRDMFLVERPMIGYGVSPLQRFIDRNLDMLPTDAYRRVALALLASEPGIFIQHEEVGTRRRVERIGDAKHFEIRANPAGDAAPPGAVCLGRLIPLGDGTYVPSAGFIRFTGDAGLDLARAAADLMTVRPPRYPVVVLEEVRTILMGIPAFPAYVRATPSHVEAVTALGLIEEAAAADVIPRRAGAGPAADRPPRPADFACDWIVAMWWMKVADEARLPRTSPRPLS